MAVVATFGVVLGGSLNVINTLNREVLLSTFLGGHWNTDLRSLDEAERNRIIDRYGEHESLTFWEIKHLRDRVHHDGQMAATYGNDIDYGALDDYFNYVNPRDGVINWKESNANQLNPLFWGHLSRTRTVFTTLAHRIYVRHLDEASPITLDDIDDEVRGHPCRH